MRLLIKNQRPRRNQTSRIEKQRTSHAREIAAIVTEIETDPSHETAAALKKTQATKNRPMLLWSQIHSQKTVTTRIDQSVAGGGAVDVAVSDDAMMMRAYPKLLKRPRLMLTKQRLRATTKGLMRLLDTGPPRCAARGDGGVSEDRGRKPHPHPLKRRQLMTLQFKHLQAWKRRWMSL
jgi:type II secretory pathway predicted ATPase ExeA